MSALEAQMQKGSAKLEVLNNKGAAWADIEALSLELGQLQSQYDAKEER